MAQLTVTITGQGEVMTPDQVLACDSSCVFEVDKGSRFVLNAHPAAGYDFNVWQGDCAASADTPTCDLDVDENKNVFAGFRERATGNSPPRAAISGDNSGVAGTVLQLSGAQSTDADGDPLTYQWAVVSTPTEANASFGSPNDMQTTFQGDGPGIYVISLVVNDGLQSSEPATFAIGLSAAAGNTPPVAVIGGDSTGETQALLQLSGAQSSDADGDALRYQWTVLSAPASANAVLGSPGAVQTTFQGDVEGGYTVSLVVDDGQDASQATAFQIQLTEPAPDSVAGTLSVSPGNFDPGATLSVTLSDTDLDIDDASAQSVTVTAFNQTTNESELLTLTETAPDSGQFAASLATAAGSPGADNDGQMLVQDGDIVRIEYQDAAPAGLAIARAYAGNLPLMIDPPYMGVANSTGIGTALTFGVVFAPDQLLPNERPMIGIGPDNFDGQVNIMTRYPNGAPQHVLFSHHAPLLPAGDNAAINFFIDPNAPPADTLSIGDLPAGYAAGTAVEIVAAGTQYSVSVADAITVSAEEHFNGPVAAEWVLHAPLTDATGAEHPWLTARFYVRLYSNGETATIPVLQNVKAFRANPQVEIALDSVAFRVGGSVRHSQTNVAIGHHSLGTPDEVYWWSQGNGDYGKSLFVLHDFAYMRDRALLFPYINPGRTYSNNWYDRWLGDTRASPGIQGLGVLNRNMPSTAWKGLVGSLPNVHLGWLTTQQPNVSQERREQSYEIMFTNTLKMGSYHVQVEDENTGEPISVETYPTADLYGSVVAQVPNWIGHYPIADTAHQPIIHMVPYLTTGWSHFLRQAKVWQTFNWLYRPHGSSRRPDPSRPEIWSEQQMRAQAWITHAMSNLVRMMPDGDPDRDYWETRFDNGIAWFYENYISPGTQRSELGFYTMVYPHSPRVRGLMLDFLATAFSHATTVSELTGVGNSTQLAALRDYGLTGTVNRLMHPETLPELWAFDRFWVRAATVDNTAGYHAPILQSLTEIFEYTFLYGVDNAAQFHPFPQRHPRGGLVPGGTFGSQARMDEINARIAAWHCAPDGVNCLDAQYQAGDQLTYRWPPGTFDNNADPEQYPEGRYVSGYRGWKSTPYYCQSAVALAVDAGIPNADAAWSRFQSFDNQWNFRDDQYQFDILPRP